MKSKNSIAQKTQLRKENNLEHIESFSQKQQQQNKTDLLKNGQVVERLGT